MLLIPEPNTIFQQVPLYLLQVAEAHHENASLWERILESNLINVLIVLGILGFLAKKANLPAAIQNQRNQLAAEIQAVELQKKEALAQLDAIKKQTQNLKSEVNAILDNAKSSAESLSAQILDDARAESQKIVENAKKRVELEQRAAAKSLEQRLLNEALNEARADLAQNLSAADQKRSVEAFLEELSEMKGVRS